MKRRLAPVFSRFALPLFAVGLTLVGVVASLTSSPVQAATPAPGNGVNQQINFQGRLLNNAGAVVADGNYNMRFKIYSGGDGCVVSGTSPCNADLQWTETRQNSASAGVVVKNGYFSVQLGSVTALPTTIWNYDILWLSTDITTNGVDTGGSPTYNGEMLPFKRITSAVQALNSQQLGGLTAGQYAQLAATQTFSATNTFSNAAGIVLSGTPASGGSLLQAGSALSGGSASGTLIGANTAIAGDLINLQVSGANRFKVTAAGAVTQASALTVQAGGASITGASLINAGASGVALTVNSGTSTGNVLELQDNGTSFLTVADGGATLFKNTVNSNFALEIKELGNGRVMRVDTSNQKVAIGAYSTSAGDTIVAQLQVIPTHDNKIGITVTGSSATQASDYYQAVNPTTGNIFRVQSSGDIQTASGVFMSNTQSAASTGSNSTSFKSGDVSGATSNSGAATFGSGNSTTSGNTGSTSLISGAATSGNSGSVNVDSGTASGTKGAVNIGTINASQINVGNGSITTAVTGNLTVASPATTTNGLAVTANALTTGSALRVTSANNSAANTGWSGGLFSVTNSQATTAVSTGIIAGLDVQFSQNASIAGNIETVANLALAANNSSVTDNTVSSILNLANNDTATGNQITATNGINLNGGNVTNGINFNGTFGTNLISSSTNNFIVTQGGAVTAVASVTTPSITNTAALTVNATSGALTLQTTTSGNVVVNGAGILDVQDAATFASDIDATFSGTENLAITSDLAGAVDVLSVVATPSATAAATRGLFVQQANSANTNGLDNALVVDNADTNLVIGAALQVTNSGGGGYTTLLDTPSLDISGGGAISGATGITSSGTIVLSGLSTNGFVKTSGGTGTLSVATSVGLGGSDVSGTLLAGNGGTGNATYVIGDLLYASSTTALSRLADVATGSCLNSGGIGVAPAWGGCGGTFTLAGTSGSSQTISAGDTLLIAAGTNITTTGVATDRVTIATVNNPVFSTSVTTPSVTAASGDLNLDSANGRVHLNSSTDITTNANLNIYSGTVSGGISNLSLQSQGTGGISIGINAANKSIDVGAVGTTNGQTTLSVATSTAATQTVTVGSTQASSVTTINGGSAINLNGNVAIGSGKTFSGAGLTDCNSQNSKVLWDSATNLFSCGTDRASVTVRKSADQTRTSSTTMLNDTEMTFAIAANEVFVLHLVVNVTFNTNAGIKYAVTAPSGATCNIDSVGYDSAGYGIELSNAACGTVATYGNVGGGPTADIQYIDATISNGATAGSVTYQFAQSVSNATATIIKAGSQMLAYKASGADLAEAYYTHDQTIGPGDVVSLDPEVTAGANKASRPYDSRVLGVISTQPGQILADPNVGRGSGRPVLVALAGRIPVKVSSVGGPIRAGDFLTASSVPGLAMKATRPGQVIGKALEDFDASRSEGLVLMFAGQQWVDPRNVDGDLMQTDMLQTAGGAVNTSDLNTSGNMTTAGDLTVAGALSASLLTVNGLASVGDLNVKGKTSVADLTVGGHITTQGLVPKVMPMAGAGQDAVVRVDGNDVSGTVTVKTGKTGLSAGDMARIEFGKPYEKPPHVVITANGLTAALLQPYLSGSSMIDFGVSTIAVPKPEELYKFEYFVTQSK